MADALDALAAALGRGAAPPRAGRGGTGRGGVGGVPTADLVAAAVVAAREGLALGGVRGSGPPTNIGGSGGGGSGGSDTDGGGKGDGGDNGGVGGGAGGDCVGGDGHRHAARLAALIVDAAPSDAALREALGEAGAVEVLLGLLASLGPPTPLAMVPPTALTAAAGGEAEGGSAPHLPSTRPTDANLHLTALSALLCLTPSAGDTRPAVLAALPGLAAAAAATPVVAAPRGGGEGGGDGGGGGGGGTRPAIVGKTLVLAANALYIPPDATRPSVAAAARATAALAVGALREYGGVDAGVTARALVALRNVAAEPLLFHEALAAADAVGGRAGDGESGGGGGGGGSSVGGLVVRAVRAFANVDVIVRHGLVALTHVATAAPQHGPSMVAAGLLPVLLRVLGGAGEGGGRLGREGDGAGGASETVAPALALVCALGVEQLLPAKEMAIEAGKAQQTGGTGGGGADAAHEAAVDAAEAAEALYGGDDWDGWLSVVLASPHTPPPLPTLSDDGHRLVDALLYWLRVASVMTTPLLVESACEAVRLAVAAGPALAAAVASGGGRAALVGILRQASAAAPPPAASLVEAALAALAAVGLDGSGGGGDGGGAPPWRGGTPPPPPSPATGGGGGSTESGDNDMAVGRVLAAAVAAVPPTPRLARLAMAAAAAAVVLPPTASATAGDAAAVGGVLAPAALASADPAVLATAIRLIGVTVGAGAAPPPPAAASDVSSGVPRTLSAAVAAVAVRPGVPPSVAAAALDTAASVRDAELAAAGGGRVPAYVAVRAAPRSLRALRLGGGPRKRVSFGSDSFHGP